MSLRRQAWLGLLALAAVGTLQSAEPQAYLGVQAEPAGSDRPGVSIAGLMPDSPAQIAGLKPGDRITHIDGVAVKDFSELASKVSDRLPGAKVEVTYVRDDAEHKTVAELKARPADEKPAEPRRQGRMFEFGPNGFRFKIPEVQPPNFDRGQRARPPMPFGPEMQSARLGMHLQNIDEPLRRRLHLPDDAKGVLVSHVEPKSAAEKAGVNVLDLITLEDGKAIEKPADLQTIAANKKPGDVIDLQVLRDDKTLTLQVKLEPGQAFNWSWQWNSTDPVPNLPDMHLPFPNQREHEQIKQRIVELEKKIAVLEKKLEAKP